MRSGILQMLKELMNDLARMRGALHERVRGLLARKQRKKKKGPRRRAAAEKDAKDALQCVYRLEDDIEDAVRELQSCPNHEVSSKFENGTSGVTAMISFCHNYYQHTAVIVIIIMPSASLTTEKPFQCAGLHSQLV